MTAKKRGETRGEKLGHEETTKDSFTALLEAIDSAAFDRVEEALYDAQCPINHTDGKGRTPLHFAVSLLDEKDTYKMVKVLTSVSGRVALNAQTFKYKDLSTGVSCGGLSAVHILASRGFAKAAMLLVNHGANPELRDFRGCTPLHYAAFRGQLDSVIVFGSSRAGCIDIQDDLGLTALHMAVLSGRSQVVERLLDDNADTCIQDSFGRTPAHYALLSSHDEMLAAILKNSTTKLWSIKSKTGLTIEDAAETLNLRESLAELVNNRELAQHGAPYKLLKVFERGERRLSRVLNSRNIFMWACILAQLIPTLICVFYLGPMYISYDATGYWHQLGVRLGATGEIICLCFHAYIVSGIDSKNRIPRPRKSSPDFLTNGKDVVLSKELHIGGKDVTVAYCGPCNAYVPPRASHCYTCGECVELADHHCLWLAGCVGKNTYRAFLLYITLATFCGLFMCLICAHCLYCRSVSGPGLKALGDWKDSKIGYALFLMWLSPLTIGLSTFGFCAFFSMGYLLQYHLKLMWSDMTTREEMKGIRHLWASESRMRGRMGNILATLTKKREPRLTKEIYCALAEVEYTSENSKVKALLGGLDADSTEFDNPLPLCVHNLLNPKKE